MPLHLAGHRLGCRRNSRRRALGQEVAALDFVVGHVEAGAEPVCDADLYENKSASVSSDEPPYISSGQRRLELTINPEINNSVPITAAMM